MKIIRANVLPIPNQVFPAIINEDSLEIHIKTIKDETFISLKVNDEDLFNNIKCFSNQFIIPYDRFNVDYNLIWISDFPTPYYERFNTQDILAILARR